MQTQSDSRKRIWCIVGMAVLLGAGIFTGRHAVGPLPTPGAPLRIISLELATDPANSRAIIEGWRGSLTSDD